MGLRKKSKKVTKKDRYNGLTQYVFTKAGVDILDLCYMHPALVSIFAFVGNFCLHNNIIMVVTSAIRPKNDGSISSTHQTGRAFDLSLDIKHGWNIQKINNLKESIEIEFSHVGAISKKTRGPRPIVIHDASKDPNYKGTKFSGLHAHFQVRPNIKQR